MSIKAVFQPVMACGIALITSAACTVTGATSGEFAAPVQVYEAAPVQVYDAAPKMVAETKPATIRAMPTSWASDVTIEPYAEIIETPYMNAAFPRLTTERSFDQRRLYASQILTEFAGLQERQALQYEPRDVRYISGQWSLSAPSERTGLGFDVDLIPRFSYSRDGAFAARSFGGELRIGQQFDRRGERHVIRGWSLFAGADGEALMWEPGRDGSMSVDRMALRDAVTVGDMQAGIAFQMGPGQWSVSYIRREVEYRERNLGASENEEFVGITFSIRR